MWQSVFTVIGIMAFFLAASIIGRGDWKKKRRVRLREKFGDVPGEREQNENVSNYYETFGEEGVDDVTWNDLSMDAVFNRINQCDSSAGEETLYAQLRRNDMTAEEREMFERRVRFFSENEDERVAAAEQLADIGKRSASYLIPSYMDGIEEYRIQNMWFFRILQAVFLITAAAAIVLQTEETAFLFFGVCVVNLVVYAVMKMKWEAEFQMAATAVRILECAKTLAKRKKTAEMFPKLKEISGKLSGVIRRTKLLESQKSAAYTGDIMWLLLDYLLGIVLWQVTAYGTIVKRLGENAEIYLEAYREVGLLDMTISTASFRKSLPWYCLPEFADDTDDMEMVGNGGKNPGAAAGMKAGRRIYMEEIYHPLIEDPVPNTLELARGALITGSNASGKSTFIKAAAVIAILGQALNTCAAQRFRMPHMQVITSMTVRDDLVAGESYFIREIRYLKRILDGLTEKKPTFCVIDEILRGTNTGERIRASRAILEYLTDKNCIPLVATHDKELTVLLADEYDNYHFSEEIGEDDIRFSYKIMEGPATSQNAVKLLEFAGFPEEIIRAALSGLSV